MIGHYETKMCDSLWWIQVIDQNPQWICILNFIVQNVGEVWESISRLHFAFAKVRYALHLVPI